MCLGSSPKPCCHSGCSALRRPWERKCQRILQQSYSSALEVPRQNLSPDWPSRRLPCPGILSYPFCSGGGRRSTGPAIVIIAGSTILYSFMIAFPQAAHTWGGCPVHGVCSAHTDNILKTIGCKWMSIWKREICWCSLAFVLWAMSNIWC